MRTLPFVFAAVAMLCSSAMANPTSAEKGDAAASSKQAITTWQLQEIEGAYKMSNGRTLHLVAIDDRLYGDLNGNDVFELVATSENTFSSRDGAISLVYQPQNAGEQIRLSYNRDLPAAVSYGPFGRDWRVPRLQQ